MQRWQFLGLTLEIFRDSGHPSCFVFVVSGRSFTKDLGVSQWSHAKEIISDKPVLSSNWPFSIARKGWKIDM